MITYLGYRADLPKQMTNRAGIRPFPTFPQRARRKIIKCFKSSRETPRVKWRSAEETHWIKSEFND